MSQAFNIVRGRKIIDTVFYNDMPVQTAQEIEKALKARGEMPYDCRVTKVRRKMTDEYQLLANYGSGHGWEVELTEVSRKELKARLKDYRENAPQYAYKMRTVRVPV